jgi:hypothetical protein
VREVCVGALVIELWFSLNENQYRVHREQSRNEPEWTRISRPLAIPAVKSRLLSLLASIEYIGLVNFGPVFLVGLVPSRVPVDWLSHPGLTHHMCTGLKFPGTTAFAVGATLAMKVYSGISN